MPIRFALTPHPRRVAALATVIVLLGGCFEPAVESLPPLSGVTSVHLYAQAPDSSGAWRARLRRTVTDSAAIAELVDFVNERGSGWRVYGFRWWWNDDVPMGWAEFNRGDELLYGVGLGGDGLQATGPRGTPFATRESAPGEFDRMVEMLGIPDVLRLERVELSVDTVRP